MAIVAGGVVAAVKRYLSMEYIVRLGLCAAGVFLIGAGVGFARFAGFGVDPFMSLSSGLYYTVFRPRGIGFGTAFLALNAVVLAAVALFDRTKIGMGTVFNMALTGYVADLTLFLLKAALPAALPLPLRAVCLLVCAALIGLGAGIYLNTNTGAAPLSPLEAAYAAPTAEEAAAAASSPGSGGEASIDDLLLAALYAHNNGRFDEAIGHYTRILALAPAPNIRALIYKHRGMAHFARSHYEAALEDFGKALETDPGSYKAAYYQGVVHSVMQNYGAAVEAFDRSLEINPYQSYCLYRRGQAWYHLEDYPKPSPTAKLPCRSNPLTPPGSSSPSCSKS